MVQIKTKEFIIYIFSIALRYQNITTYWSRIPFHYYYLISILNQHFYLYLICSPWIFRPNQTKRDNLFIIASCIASKNLFWVQMMLQSRDEILLLHFCRCKRLPAIRHAFIQIDHLLQAFFLYFGKWLNQKYYD